MEIKLNGKYNCKIRCTYLELFDAKRNKIFSLQKAGFPGVVGTFDSTKAKPIADKEHGRFLVPVVISEDVKEILKIYSSEYLKADKGVILPLKNKIEDVYLVNYAKAVWIPQIDSAIKPGDYEKEEDVETPEQTEEETQKKGKIKLALAAAALLTFLN